MLIEPIVYVTGVPITIPGYGRVSWFGGPDDNTMGRFETLALYPTTRRWDLDPNDFYCALPVQWRQGPFAIRQRREGYWPWRDVRDWWRAQRIVWVRPDFQRAVVTRVVDLGPNWKMMRVGDLSPGAMTALGVKTDDPVYSGFGDPALPLGPIDPVKLGIRPK